MTMMIIIQLFLKSFSGLYDAYHLIEYKKFNYKMSYFHYRGIWGDENMTIQDIKEMKKEILTPGDIAPILGCDPNVIRYQASQDIKQLGFPAAKVGSRVKIPRKAFISWFEGCTETQK